MYRYTDISVNNAVFHRQFDSQSISTPVYIKKNISATQVSTIPNTPAVIFYRSLSGSREAFEAN